VRRRAHIGVVSSHQLLKTHATAGKETQDEGEGLLARQAATDEQVHTEHSQG
jgi:hypothetical protein